MNRSEELLEKTKSLGLPRGDFAIFGSSRLYLCGLSETIHDIDIIARGEVWKKACTLGVVESPKSRRGDIVRLFEGDIEISNEWTYGPWDIDNLINTADYIDGLPFVTLENVLKWKIRRRAKNDDQDIEKLQNYLKVNIINP